MVNYSMVAFMAVSVALLFTAMVLSAMASSDANKGCDDCKEGCHKYSMWSALVTGLAVGVIVIIMIMYIYSSRKQIAGHAQQQAAAIHGYLGQYAGSQGQITPQGGMNPMGYTS